QFEKAAKLRDKIESIKHINDKQKITSSSLGNKDVIAVADISSYVCIMLLNIRDGKMINREHFVLKNKNKESKEGLLTDFVKQHYSLTNFIPNKIFLQYYVEDIELIGQWLSEKCGNKISVTVPQKGENLQLVKMAENNAIELLKLHVLKHDISKKKMNDLVYQIKNTFGLENPPMRIESYDISNISGADSVGVCVVYENGVPKKSAYRLFNIKSVEGADDYGSISETLYRRLENGVENVNGFELPDLILIDGGRGHVKAAKEIVDFYKLDIPVFGMVKDDHHRTRGVTTESEEIQIKRTDTIFKFLTQIQDETHRFAITSFHKKHKKSTLKSELTNIKGVGDAKKNKLLMTFKSINTIKEADIE
ncbi:MAG: excinuclease ABC subunit C, partial [Clostridia bacterium]|nr:excinuclease ABC subunit C [Clostridia bacterium]